MPSVIGRYERRSRAVRRRGEERSASPEGSPWSYHVRWDDGDLTYPWTVVAVNNETEREESYDDEELAWR